MSRTEKNKLNFTVALIAEFADTFDRLSNPATGLYYQSAGYVFDYLKKEITTGRIA